ESAPAGELSALKIRPPDRVTTAKPPSSKSTTEEKGSVLSPRERVAPTGRPVLSNRRACRALVSGAVVVIQETTKFPPELVETEGLTSTPPVGGSPVTPAPGASEVRARAKPPVPPVLPGFTSAQAATMLPP